MERAVMTQPHVDKWTPFLLSLIVPGAGQVLAGSWSALPWFAATVGLGAIWSMMPGNETLGITAMRVGSLALLSVCSAEHAKRLLETRADRPHSIARARVSY